MKNYNNSYPAEYAGNIENPIVVEEVRQLSSRTDNIIANVSNALNNISVNAVEISRISADVQLQCAQLEHMLNCMMVKAQRDVTLYEKSLPILDKQFNFCQQRLDKLMDKAVDLISDDISDASLARQEAIMTLIETTNSSINNLISKLIPSL